MDIKTTKVSLLFLFVLFVMDNAVAWEGKTNNKPIAELELMRPDELILEAWGPSMSYAVISEGIKKTADPVRARNLRLDTRIRQSEAVEYLGTIKLVARKNNGGKDPEWHGKLMAALTEGADKCRNVLRKALDKARKTERDKKPSR